MLSPRLVRVQMALGVLATIGLAGVLWWPLTTVYWPATHEVAEYVSRVVDYQSELSRGVLYPRWAPSFYGGYGSPFFDFYAPLVYWLGAVLSMAAGSPLLGLKLVALLGSLLAGLGAFALVYEETRRADAALAASCAYLAAPYRLANISWRGDLAELLALGILPLAMLAYRRIARAELVTQLPLRVSCATLVHAALVCCHTITGLWGTGFALVLIVLSIVPLWRRRAHVHVFACTIAFVAALLTSSFYTLPALAEKGFVRTETMVVSEVAPENNLLALADLVRPGPHRIGPLLALAFAGAAIAVGVARVRKRRIPLAPLPWLLGACALCALMLDASAPIWTARVIPFGDYIQFPWRLLGPASLAAAVALGCAWPHVLPARAALLALALPFAAASVGLPSTAMTSMAISDVRLTPDHVRRAFVRGTAFDEYLPRVVTLSGVRVARKVARSTEAIEVESSSSAGTVHDLVLVARAPGQLALALHAFPGWTLQAQSGPAGATLRTGETGLLTLQVPSVGRYTLRVLFGSTPVRDGAAALSWLGALGAMPATWLLVRRARRRRAPASMPQLDIERGEESIAA